MTALMNWPAAMRPGGWVRWHLGQLRVRTNRTGRREVSTNGMPKCCKNCALSHYDTSNKGNWYCNKLNTHKDANDYCGYYQPE